VVRADGPLRGIEDLAAARWGWTARDSQSGYHAPRDFLAREFGRLTQQPETFGGLLNPVGILAAVRDNRISAGAVDAFAWHLIERLEPETLAGLRILATTVSRPMPMLVAARSIDAATLWRLQTALLHLAQDAEGRVLLDAIDVEGFAPVDPCDYDVLPRLAAEADAILEADW
jgi:ABC-type phosphate/phosphonate transport system substrate-binding protein